MKEDKTVNVPELIACIVALIIGVVTYLLISRGAIRKETISAVADILESLSGSGGDIFSKIMAYSEMAVLAVEQMVKKGELEKNDDIRKAQAMTIVQTAAHNDGIEMDGGDIYEADMCIEACVQRMKREQAKT